MALTTYRAKRDFKRTPEPKGTHAKSGAALSSLSFVIQKHAATHLHYDFRLELDGVLLSWAVPKGPSLDPADKRLAIHVEDHPLAYGEFEGTIPSKQYGAGTVMVWDRGIWIPDSDPLAGMKQGHLRFHLSGEKLKGGWSLVRTRSARYGGKSGDQAWLLIKADDDAAQRGAHSILDSAPDSVVSKRTLTQIENGDAAKANVAPMTRIRGYATDRKTSRGAKSDIGKPVRRLPQHLQPPLATLATAAPTGDEWSHEIKYDGYRMLARIDRGRCRLFSRSGKEWTTVFATVASDLVALPVKEAWVDGEVVVLDRRGRSRFALLQTAIADPGKASFTFFAFDVPFVDGRDLREVPLHKRKQRLRDIVGDGVGGVRVGSEVMGSGAEFFRQSCSMSLEGAVSKRIDSLYADGRRTRDWLKIKCGKRQELVIGGYTDPRGTRTDFGALLLGVYRDDQLHYAGKVGTGFDHVTLGKLGKRMRAIKRTIPPFVNPPRGFEAQGAHWIKPELVAEVTFTEWSRDGALRHPAFVGLRLDKSARDVIREEPEEDAMPDPTPVRTNAKSAKEKPAKEKSAKEKSANGKTSVVAGITLSHPDKVYFPEIGLTKRELANYYEDVAPWLLPHVHGRPLSLVRCPDGWQGQCFYQKHADPAVHAAVPRIEIKTETGGGQVTYMSVASAKSCVALVQWGVIELHPWGAKQPRLERPDRLIFDFDPDEKVKWSELVEAVGVLKTMLDEFALRGFLKTTGGKGLHVVVPIRATLDWAEAKSFSKAVADMMARTFPTRITASMAKEKRRGKIFLDYLRNTRGATAVAPYVVRAREHAPVATPIDWQELTRDVRYGHFNVNNVRARLHAGIDPWQDFGSVRQTVTKSAARRLGLEW